MNYVLKKAKISDYVKYVYFVAVRVTEVVSMRQR